MQKSKQIRLFDTAFLEQLQAKEKEKNVTPDPTVDSYLKAIAVEGKRSNAVTQFVMRVLGLEVSSLICTGILRYVPMLVKTPFRAQSIGHRF